MKAEQGYLTALTSFIKKYTNIRKKDVNCSVSAELYGLIIFGCLGLYHLRLSICIMRIWSQNLVLPRKEHRGESEVISGNQF